MLLIDDLVKSYGAPNQSSRAWLLERGVPHTAMIGWPGPIGIVRFQTYDDGFFEFNDDGNRTYYDLDGLDEYIETADDGQNDNQKPTSAIGERRRKRFQSRPVSMDPNCPNTAEASA